MDGRGFPCFERDFAGAGQGLDGRGAPVGGRGPGEPLPARTGCRQALPPRSANTPAGPPSGRTGLPLVPGPAPLPLSDNVGRGAGGAQWPLSPTPQVDGGSAGHVRKPLLHRLGTGPRSHAARGCDQAGFSATATLPSPWSPKAVPLPSVSVLASGCKPGQLLARERAGSGCCVLCGWRSPRDGGELGHGQDPASDHGCFLLPAPGRTEPRRRGPGYGCRPQAWRPSWQWPPCCCGAAWGPTTGSAESWPAVGRSWPAGSSRCPVPRTTTATRGLKVPSPGWG